MQKQQQDVVASENKCSVITAKQILLIGIVIVILNLVNFQPLYALPVTEQSISNTKVTITLNHETMESAFKKIESQTPFRFYYRKSYVDQFNNLNMVTVTITVEKLLNVLLENTTLSFRLMNKNILLEPKDIQTSYEISGHLVDIKHNPIEFATISIRKPDDTKIIQSVVSAADGSFKLSVKNKGEYIADIKSIGLDGISVSVIVGDKTSVQLPEITLNATTKVLQEVNVIAKKPIIELRSDRMLFNVGNSINGVGEDALQVLKRAPGVSVSNSDIVSLKGNSGVQIMINGRSTYLGGGDLASVLKNIPAANIDQIEIISNPSSKFDAAGTAGIINIKLKKNKNFGFNGTLNLNGTQGYTSKFNGGIDGNYRSEKLNVYGSYSYDDGIYKTKTSILRSQEVNGTSAKFDQHSDEFDGNKSHSYKAGLDYFIDNRNTLGVLFNGSNGHNNDNISGNTIISNGSGNIDSILTAKNNRLIKRNNYNYNLNYQYADTSGKTFTSNFNYILLDRKELSLQPNQYTNSAGNSLADPLIYFINAPTKINVYAANIDYEQKLFKGTFGTGAKFSSVESKNDFNSYNVIDGLNVINPALTNFFNYNEKVSAAYINYNFTVKKWTYQAGLRGEQTSSDGRLTTLTANGNEVVRRSYLNLFPTASIAFKQNDNHSFSLSYSRRIQRPNYQNLNPFQIRMDELTFFQGNPFLKPEYSDSFQLAYAWQQYLIASVGYMETTNVVSPITDSTSNNRIISSYQNIGKNRSVTVSLSTSLDINKWWSLFINTNLYYQNYKGNLPNGVVNNSITTFSANGSSTFKITHSLSSELSFFYRTPEVYGVLKNSSVGEIDLGAKQSLFNDRASLRLSFSDIFHMLKLTSRSYYSGLNLISTQQPESQVFKIGFSYKFGRSQIKGARSRAKGAEDESGRLH
ncbi:outer membrane beta-barrel family protein [Mucilaginibacter sp. KACC 22773]|uniref:outer membrane beta-barrel family protein n=1 Tax=Mucilaginibacter sp. KACC 22773 TaxID=3025671 RepID=UPI0023667B44|nr:outer membrane beta-barrel family protein [Mucilaginibacter sp. KACC 22773]WDF77668.1 outer membrane beta-barrel family protein [Mucilaginibacter sp. KACC 22773]